MTVAAFTLLAAASAAAAVPQLEPRSAFFCQVGERGASDLRPLNILLARTADVAGEAEPIETFDPSSLLGGRSFTRFMRSHTPEAQGYVLVTGGTREPGTFLLSLVARPDGELGAGLGAIAEGSRPRFMGRCIGYRSADTAADFHSFNAKKANK